MFRFARTAAPLLIAAASIIPVPAQAVDELHWCGWQHLHIWMEQVPENWNAFEPNDYSMWTWSQYMDIYRYTNDDGSWGMNNENEIAGFPSEADLQATWGFSWGTALAKTVFKWQDPCYRLRETDVAYNPGETWTYDRADAEYSSKIYMHSASLHELGHVWGAQTQYENYDFDVPTVMEGYTSDVEQDRNEIHRGDAYMIRRNYDEDISVPTMRDMGVVSKYADGPWRKAETDKSVYTTFDNIDIEGLTVENTGTVNLSNVRVRIYLSTNRTISTSDHLCGHYQWDSFPKETWWTGDLNNCPIPNNLSGTYYVGAIVSRNGAQYDDDDWDQNDTARLLDPITIKQPFPTNKLLYFIPSPAGGSSLLQSAINQGVASGQILTALPASNPASFGQMIIDEDPDLVIVAQRPGGDSTGYEEQLIDYLRHGGAAIIADPRSPDAGAQGILQAAGAAYSGQENAARMVGLNVLGTAEFELAGGTQVFSTGLSPSEGAAVYARFVDGDPAIVGVGGRTFVLGFDDSAIPVDADSLGMASAMFDVLGTGRGEPQARVTYKLRQATWTLDAAGNVADVTLLANNQIDIDTTGGVVGFAVLASVETTDSDGLAEAEFDLVASGPEIAFSPLNLGVPYHDPDTKPTPAIRPLVDQSGAPVSAFNSVFSAAYDAGTPAPGALSGVLLAQEIDGPAVAITRGVGQMGNDLTPGSTILGVGTLTVPPGTGDYTVHIAPAASGVYVLAPHDSAAGEPRVFDGESEDDSLLRIVRPATFVEPPDDWRYEDLDVCTWEYCDETGGCSSTLNAYGDVNHDGGVGLQDIICMLDGYRGVFVECGMTDLDIGGCAPDGRIDLFDIFAVLDAFAGHDACCSPVQ